MPRRFGELIPTAGAVAAAALTACALLLTDFDLGLRLAILVLALALLGVGLLLASRSRARVRRGLERRLAEMEAEKGSLERLLSASVSSQLSAGLRPDLAVILAQVAEGVGAQVAVAYVLEAESGILTPMEGPVGVAPGSLQDHRLSSLAEDPVNQVLLNLRPQLRSEATPISFRLLPRSLEMRSLVVAPMLVEDQPVGLIVLGAEAADRFTDKDADLAMATAASCGAALVNDRLLTTSRRQLRHSGVVKEVALAVNSTLELGHVLHLFLGKARGIVDYDRACVTLFADTSFRIEALVDAEGALLRRPAGEMHGPLEGSIYTEARGGSIVSRPALGESDAYATEPPGEVRLGVAYSEVIVPLRAKGEVAGCVAFRAPRPNAFDPHIYPALYELANLGGMAITNSMVHAGTASQARHLDLLLNSLSEVSRMLTATTEGPDALERRIVATVARLFDSPVAVLSRTHDGNHVVAASHGADLEGLRGEALKVVPGAGLIGAVALRQTTLTRRADAPELLPPLPATVPVTQGLAAPMFLDGQFMGALAVFSSRDYDDDEATVLTTVANQVAVALRNAELFHRSQRSLWELANLHEGLQAIASSLDLQHVLDSILSKAAAVSGAQIGSIMLLENGRLAVRATYGTDGTTAQNLTFGVGDGIAGRVVESREPILANDVERHPAFQPPPRGAIVPKALLCVPMQLGDDVIGVINLSNYVRTNVFEEDSVRVVTALATQTSIAVENARLYQHLRAERDRLIRLEEVLRQDLARDLHDGPVQRLAGMAMNIEVIKTLLKQDVAKAGAELDELEGLVHKTIREARTMLFELRPLVLETQGLPAALRSYAEQFEANTGLAMELDIDDDLERFPPAVEQTLFSVIQEALGNVRKHARASGVTVSLRMEGDQIVGRVADDGRGFDVKATQEGYSKRASQSLGLVNMVERAERIGGRFKLDSRPGTGTSVSIAVPRRFLQVEPASDATSAAS